ncbi:Mni1p protein [Cordyceps javanica]|uniref:Mni1p protein n=1 Tax=Cordyceps javanica TaxID=43265 RepID=A0A545V2R0_9HYPO|nr:Mni1p protein [Cordyceps javanica]
MTFSFGFAGDDIDTSHDAEVQPIAPTSALLQAGAFPVAGKPQLPATRLDLSQMLAAMPSKIAYSVLDVTLDDDSVVKLPRRELWDVRVQLMAEEEDNAEHGVDADGSGLGTLDVKTGVYEGGFKSWESSVDLVKVLAAQGKVSAAEQLPLRIIELVTLPNFILAWALSTREHTPALRNAFTLDDELELLPEVIAAFQSYLIANRISLTFLSGAWSPEFIETMYNGTPDEAAGFNTAAATLLLGAETIYSPFALQAFMRTTFAILQREKEKQDTSPAVALVAAKKMYFGVGGSLDDFVDQARDCGGHVITLREEADGVRRGVVKCTLQE